MLKISTVFVLLLLIATPATAQVVIQTLPAQPVTNWFESSFWETMDGRPAEESWEFDESEIRLIKPRGGRGSLISGPLPSHFELSWQWKINKKTNSGLKYRVRKFSGRWLGLEYQIIDEPVDRLPNKGSTASIYDLVAPQADRPLKPTGQWNRSRVVAVGDRAEHYLNGTLVASTATAGPTWDAKIAVSKFWGAEDFGKPKEGDRVMLTDHGGRVTYKDFKLVAHQAPTAGQIATAPPFLGNGMRNSWADQSSIVLWTRTTARPDMVTDGPRFHEIGKGEIGKLSKVRDELKLMAAQIPSGAKLSEMFGACPGAAGEVRLTYFPSMQRNAAKSTDWTATAADQDFTAQWKLESLKADTRYAAVIETRPVGSEEVTAVVRGAFQTAPPKKKQAKFNFCMTTCHDFIRRDDGLQGHKIYPTMSKMQPDFVVHAGDIEYYDKPDPWALTIELMRFKWGRIFSLPSNRDFYNSTTSYFLKDDHDTLKNDCWAGQTYGSVTFQQGVRLFNEEQFPSHAPRYKTVQWGKDVQIWFLEGRDYRSPNDMPDGPNKTILGDEQKKWLFKTLSESRAAFKLVFSPTPVVGPDRANKKDNHANDVYQHEGNQIRGELAKHGNVIVFCGDRHWQYASVDPESKLWEFGCGPGSEKHQLGWKQGDERPEHQFLRVAGGFLSGEVTHDGDKNPTLTIRHHEVTGKQVSEFQFPKVWSE